LKKMEVSISERSKSPIKNLQKLETEKKEAVQNSIQETEAIKDQRTKVDQVSKMEAALLNMQAASIPATNL